MIRDNPKESPSWFSKLAKNAPTIWFVLSSIFTIFIAGYLFFQYSFRLQSIGLWILGFGASGYGLINIFASPRGTDWLRVSNKLLGVVLIFSGFFVLHGWQIQDYIRQLEDARVTAAGYRDTLMKDVKLPFKGGTPWQVQQFLLGTEHEHIEEVRILGINATGTFHPHRSNFQRILEKMLEKNEGDIKILLLHPNSSAFSERVQFEEGKVNLGDGNKPLYSNRIRTEWNASIAILRDIVNHLLEKKENNDVNDFNNKLKKLKPRLKIKLFQQAPNRSIIFVKRKGKKETVKIVKTPKDLETKKYLVLNLYPKSKKLHGQRSLSLLVNEKWTEYCDNLMYFDCLWNDDGTVDFTLDGLVNKTIPPLLEGPSLNECSNRTKLPKYMASSLLDEENGCKDLLSDIPKGGNNIGKLFEDLSKSTDWKLVKKIKLNLRTYHPQEMVKVGSYFYISAVEITKRTEKYKDLDIRVEDGKPDRTEGKGVGHLFKVDGKGNLVDSVTLGDKARAIYHPGGIDFDGKWLWVPVAQYRPHSLSIIYRVNIEDLSVEKVFEFEDHISGVVYNRRDHTLYGMSWGSRTFYTWDLEGHVIRRAQNHSHYVDYQDCQYIKDSYMLCGGTNEYFYPDPKVVKFALGGIALIHLESGIVKHQIPLMLHAGKPKPNPRIVMTGNPVFAEVRGDQLQFYFMPEDDNSTIYIYRPQ